MEMISLKENLKITLLTSFRIHLFPSPFKPVGWGVKHHFV